MVEKLLNVTGQVGVKELAVRLGSFQAEGLAEELLKRCAVFFKGHVVCVIFCLAVILNFLELSVADSHYDSKFLGPFGCLLSCTDPHA